MAILVISGTAADLDWLSYLGGAGVYFHYHSTVLHSIAGSAILALILALIICWATKKYAKTPLKFERVLLLCAIGAAGHLLLDLATSDGVQLLWPFSGRWFAWDLLTGMDPWILAILLAGLLVPGLLRLVSEEIGEKKKKPGPSRGAVAALVLMALYIGWRADLHYRAVQMLLANDYHGAMAMVAGAFPDTDSPLTWRGVVDTENTIEEVNVPFGPGATFDAMSSLTHYKPRNSPVLEAARSAPLAREFLRYAQFPVAEEEDLGDGYRVTLQDMRFPEGASTPDDLIAVIDLDNGRNVRYERMRFARESGRRSR